MKMINDYRCDTCNETKEYWIDPNDTPKCDQCGSDQSKLISGGSFFLDPMSGDFPGATNKWCKNRDIKIAQEQRIEANHGPQDW